MVESGWLRNLTGKLFLLIRYCALSLKSWYNSCSHWNLLLQNLCFFGNLNAANTIRLFSHRQHNFNKLRIFLVWWKFHIFTSELLVVKWNIFAHQQRDRYASRNSSKYTRISSSSDTHALQCACCGSYLCSIYIKHTSLPLIVWQSNNISSRYRVYFFHVEKTFINCKIGHGW